MRIMSLIYILNFIIGMSVGRWKETVYIVSGTSSAVSNIHWWSSEPIPVDKWGQLYLQFHLDIYTYGLKWTNTGRCYYISIYMTIKNKSQWELLTVS